MRRPILISLFLVSAGLSASAQKYISRSVEVSFLSETPIENIEAFNNQVSSILDLSTGEIVFQVPIRGFHFENALMEEHFNENYMDTEEFPRSTLQGRIENFNNYSSILSDGTPHHITVKGTIEIHGISFERSFEGTITKSGNNYVVSSEFEVDAVDYEIDIPSLVRKQIAESIIVSVNATLTPR